MAGRKVYKRYQNRPEQKTPLKLANFGWHVDTQARLRFVSFFFRNVENTSPCISNANIALNQYSTALPQSPQYLLLSTIFLFVAYGCNFVDAACSCIKGLRHYHERARGRVGMYTCHCAQSLVLELHGGCVPCFSLGFH